MPCGKVANTFFLIRTGRITGYQKYWYSTFIQICRSGARMENRARQEIQLILIYESSDNHNKINNLLE